MIPLTNGYTILASFVMPLNGYQVFLSPCYRRATAMRPSHDASKS